MASKLVGKTIGFLILSTAAGVVMGEDEFSQPPGSGFSFRPLIAADSTSDALQQNLKFRPNEELSGEISIAESTENQQIDTGDYVFRPPRERRGKAAVSTGESELICPAPAQPVQQAAPYGGYAYPQQPYQQTYPYSGYPFTPMPGYAPMPGYLSPAAPGAGYTSPYGTPGGLYPQWPGSGGFGFPMW